LFAILISDAWPQYYASSPFKNFLDIPPDSHPDFEIIPVNGAMFSNDEFLAKLRTFRAIVVDDVFAIFVKFLRDYVPILMIDGDAHRHRPDQISELMHKYSSVDFVLTGAHVDVELPQYFYPPKSLRKQKSLYYPHSAPGVTAPSLDWDSRKSKIALSGSMGPEVYPFRAGVSGLHSPVIERLYFQENNHYSFFQKLSTYKAAVTCSSIFQYTVAKYFEIPWCGTALIATELYGDEAELLGMVDEENVIFRKSAADLISIYPPHLGSLADAGRRLITERHTILHRLEYLSRLIKKILPGGFKAGDELDIFKTAHIKESGYVQL